MTTEIPKDGKCYAAWHKDHGLVITAWVDYQVSTDCLGWYNILLHESVDREYHANKFARYQNQSGRWIELNDTPK